MSLTVAMTVMQFHTKTCHKVCVVCYLFVYFSLYAKRSIKIFLGWFPKKCIWGRAICATNNISKECSENMFKKLIFNCWWHYIFKMLVTFSLFTYFLFFLFNFLLAISWTLEDFRTHLTTYMYRSFICLYFYVFEIWFIYINIYIQIDFYLFIYKK